MPAEQYGRWVSAAGTTAFAQDGSPAAALALACALHAINEVSKGVEPGLAAAVLTISGPDGTVLGQLAADAPGRGDPGQARARDVRRPLRSGLRRGPGGAGAQVPAVTAATPIRDVLVPKARAWVRVVASLG
ncbi:hypothetical protein [Streptomyces sp. NPDC000395]|uniref:hypothetical protein n=1 Tax=Streptomyces sp. NPDC000395 TaxID=3154252 RepID=UPI00336A7697